MEITSNDTYLQDNCSVLYHLQKWRTNKENNCPHILSDDTYTSCKQNEIIYQWINNYREDIESNIHIVEFTHTSRPRLPFQNEFKLPWDKRESIPVFQVHKFYTSIFFFF